MISNFVRKKYESKKRKDRAKILHNFAFLNFGLKQGLKKKGLFLMFPFLTPLMAFLFYDKLHLTPNMNKK